MLGMTSRGLVGLLLIVVGTVALAPGAMPGTSGLAAYGLVPAILLLTLGTWLVGTDINGRPV